MGPFLNALDFLVHVTDDDPSSPDAETDGDSGSTELIGDSDDSSTSSAGTEEIPLGVPVVEVLRTLQLTKRFFEERGRQFDLRFVTQLNRMLSAVEAQQAGIAVRKAVKQSDIRGFFSP